MGRPITLITAEELASWRNRVRPSRIGFVPTMGALHEGHGSLVDSIREKCDHTVVSIFVNPLQFGPHEDFEKYPRTFKDDLDLLAEKKVSAVYIPNVKTMYSDDFQTQVVNNRMSKELCGLARPGHFDGVLTVVLKLFNLVDPDVVAFGKKDYQQYKLISRMIKDLNIDIEILGCETVRERDGLAMSSRNRYLSSEERDRATALSKGLMAAKSLFEKGERSISELILAARHIIQEKQIQLEYLEVRDRENLKQIGMAINVPAVMLVAARVGQTRLIDNIEL